MIYKPSEYFGTAPPPRFIGTETECNIQLRQGATVNSYMTDLAIKRAGFIRFDKYLDNGGKLYNDLSHLEYGTPESLGPRQAAAADLSGILVVGKIVEAARVPHNGVHRHSGTIIGDKAKTSGYHENYLMPRELAYDPLLAPIMSSHLASRLYSFSGIVGVNGFQLSQKARGIGGSPISADYSRRTSHGSKPMALLPSADHDTIGSPSWQRLEVRFADAGFSSTGRFLTFASTSLVLRLLEHRRLVNEEVLRSLAFYDAPKAAKIFSDDLRFKKTAETINGKRITAVDYQHILADASAALAERIELPEDEAEAIPLWIEVCDMFSGSDLPNGHYNGLLDVTDLAPRHRFISARLEPSEIKSANRKAVALSLIMDRILPFGGSMQYWNGRPTPYVDPQEVADLVHTPPNTRALLRGKVIRHRLGSVASMDWANIRKTNGKNIPLAPTFVAD